MDKIIARKIIAYGHIEAADEKLRSLCTTLEILAGAARCYDGAEMEDVLCHVVNSLRDVRAELDMACA